MWRRYRPRTQRKRPRYRPFPEPRVPGSCRQGLLLLLPLFLSLAQLFVIAPQLLKLVPQPVDLDGCGGILADFLDRFLRPFADAVIGIVQGGGFERGQSCASASAQV